MNKRKTNITCHEQCKLKPNLEAYLRNNITINFLDLTICKKTNILDLVIHKIKMNNYTTIHSMSNKSNVKKLPSGTKISE